MLASCILLLSVLLCFTRSNLLASMGLVASCCVVVLQENVSWLGMMALLTLFVCARAYGRLADALFHTAKFKELVLALLSISLVSGLILHKLPGFTNMCLFNHVVLTPLSNPYTMYVNFDKILCAFVLFMAMRLDRIESEINSTSLKQTFCVFLACSVVILSPALLSGFVKLEVKLPGEFWVWALNNLFFVCFAEEVIFRGVLQRKLQQMMGFHKWGAAVAIVLASLVFGLAHIKNGGPVYAVLAAVCGLFYGYAYHKTQSIRCSMLVHFGLNAIHFIFFTYPSAARLG